MCEFDYQIQKPIGKVVSVVEDENGITAKFELNDEAQKFWEDIFDVKKENKMKKIIWKLFKKNKPCYKACNNCKWAKYCKDELI